MLRVMGLFSILKCIAMLGGVLGAVYWLTFRGKSRNGDRVPSDLENWIKRTLFLILGLSIVLVLATGIELRDRWFQPIVFLGAIWAALFVRPRLNSQTEKRFSGAVLLVAVLVLTILPGIPLAASVTNRPTRLNAPYAALCAELKGRVGVPPAILASTRWVGGNLRLKFPSSRVVVPELKIVKVDPRAPCLVVWDASKSPGLPQRLIDLVVETRGGRISDRDALYVEAPFKYTRAKNARLGYLVLPADR
jgi:hypothetical protein